MRRCERAIAFDATMMDKVVYEFIAYQLLTEEDLPQSVWESATEKLENVEVNSSEDLASVRMDVVWGFLSTIKTGDGCTLKFPDL